MKRTLHRCGFLTRVLDTFFFAIYVAGMAKHPLRAWREKRGLSVADAAEELSVSRQFVYMIERGATNCGVRSAPRISRLTGISLSDLLTANKTTKEKA